MAKNKPCCARRQAQLTMDTDDLRVIARKLARKPESTRLRQALDKAKVQLEQTKKAVVDHEAEHAGEVD